MKAKRLVLVSLILVALAAFFTQATSAQRPQPKNSVTLGGGFTYQGHLVKNGSPVTASPCDFTFTLWTDAEIGQSVGVPVVQSLAVSNGYFTSNPIDFGPTTFNGTPYYLQTAVRCPSDSESTTLPRQRVTAAPHALYAANGPFWSLAGNAGTTPVGQFIGTTDLMTLTLKVNDRVGWRLVPSMAIPEDTPNVVGGYIGNYIPQTVSGGTIGGGGGFFAPDNYFPNQVLSPYATIGGGFKNTASGFDATIGGGFGNSATENDATIGGGSGNTASSRYATVSGGYENTANGWASVVGGGSTNNADGVYSSVPGGRYNSAAMAYTLAAGRRAKADHTGTFVWADSDNYSDQGTDFASTGIDQFLIRAGGGVGINTNTPVSKTLTVGGNGLRVGTNGTNIKLMESGTFTVGAGADGINVRAITFPTPFSSCPRVMVTVRGEDNKADTFAVTTRNITTNTFTVNIVRIDPTQFGKSWAQNLQLDWVAWE